MMRSMFAGVSGLRNHQTRMDVIGNNIANVNTVGYKSSRVTFQDSLSQTLKGATAPQNNRGGINPQQVGLGVTLSSIDVLHTAGNLQTTGVNTDLAIQGNGFFVFNDGNQQYFSRAGNVRMDTSGRLVASNGLQIQGWDIQDPTRTLKGITLPINSTIAPQTTTEINYYANFNAGLNGTLVYDALTVGTAEMAIKLTPTGNTNEWRYEVDVTGGSITGGPGDGNGVITLDSNGDIITNTGLDFEVTPDSGVPISITVPVAGGSNTFVNTDDGTSVTGEFTAPSFTSSVEVFDSRGTAHMLTTTFTKVDNVNWNWNTIQDGDTTATSIGSGSLTFNTQGKLTSTTGGPITFNPPGADPVQINPVFSEITQYDGETSIAWEQNGYEMGYLDSFKIDNAGKIIGVFTNGLTQDIAQVAIATFSNPGGLEKVGETMFVRSNNSGEPQINESGVAGSGKVTPGTLEMSNVDLSQEFTDMIVTQRGFQANSRIITTSDEMLQELVNLKR